MLRRIVPHAFNTVRNRFVYAPIRLARYSNDPKPLELDKNTRPAQIDSQQSNNDKEKNENKEEEEKFELPKITREFKIRLVITLVLGNIINYEYKKYKQLSKDIETMKNSTWFWELIDKNPDLTKFSQQQRKQTTVILSSLIGLLQTDYLMKTIYDQQVEVKLLEILKRNHTTVNDLWIISTLEACNDILTLQVLAKTDDFAKNLIKHDAIPHLATQYSSIPAPSYHRAIVSFFYKESLCEELLKNEKVLHTIHQGLLQNTNKKTYELAYNLLVKDLNQEEIPPIFSKIEANKQITRKNETMHLFFHHVDTREKIYNVSVALLWLSLSLTMRKAPREEVLRKQMIALPFFALLSFGKEPLERFIGNKIVKFTMDGKEEPPLWKFALMNEALTMFWLVNWMGVFQYSYYVNFGTLFILMNVWRWKYILYYKNEIKE